VIALYEGEVYACTTREGKTKKISYSSELLIQKYGRNSLGPYHRRVHIGILLYKSKDFWCGKCGRNNFCKKRHSVYIVAAT
jgi:hypothetical protein